MNQVLATRVDLPTTTVKQVPDIVVSAVVVNVNPLGSFHRHVNPRPRLGITAPLNLPDTIKHVCRKTCGVTNFGSKPAVAAAVAKLRFTSWTRRRSLPSAPYSKTNWSVRRRAYRRNLSNRSGTCSRPRFFAVSARPCGLKSITPLSRSTWPPSEFGSHRSDKIASLRLPE